MRTLFFKKAGYFFLAILINVGVSFLAYLLFIHFVLKDGCTDGATFFVYWIIVLFIIYAVSVDFYERRPRIKKYSN